MLQRSEESKKEMESNYRHCHFTCNKVTNTNRNMYIIIDFDGKLESGQTD